MPEDVILYERRNTVALITINRPETLNALNIPTLLKLEEAAVRAERDPDVHVVVFTGAGDRAFIAGGDIAELNSRQGLAHYQEFAEVIHRVFRRIEVLDKPTIAAVNGWALGGGTELLLCLDIRLVAASAKLGLPEINLGMFPGAGGSQRIIRQIPPCRAKELMFTGDRFSAEEALAYGLINRVVPDGELMAEAFALAERIATKSPLTLKFLKRTLEDGAAMPFPASLRHEQAMIGLVLDSHDAHEGCTAFLEKRPPAFKGA